MGKISLNEYVRTIDGKIGVFDRYSSRPDTSIYKSPFNCFIKMQGRKTPLQCIRDYIKVHSTNITDLIEEGDYVNGKKVYSIGTALGLKTINFEDGTYNTEVKTIATKEQMQSITYKIEEE